MKESLSCLGCGAVTDEFSTYVIDRPDIGLCGACIEKIRDDRDTVYRERAEAAQLAAILAFRLGPGYMAGWGTDPSEPDYPVLYIDTPCGQLSWHIRRGDVIAELPRYEAGWDGSDDKSARIARLSENTMAEYREWEKGLTRKP